MSFLKGRVIAFIIALGLLLLALFYNGLYSPGKQLSLQPNNPPTSQNEEIIVTSTDPAVLENATLLPNQSFKISFNTPLLSIDELKYRVDPPVDLKKELSLDGKTVTFSPTKGFSLGQGYTLFILPDTNFKDSEGKKKPLGKEVIYHFKTINYRGA